MVRTIWLSSLRNGIIVVTHACFHQTLGWMAGFDNNLRFQVLQARMPTGSIRWHCVLEA
jgi:hypothetical protein